MRIYHFMILFIVFISPQRLDAQDVSCYALPNAPKIVYVLKSDTIIKYIVYHKNDIIDSVVPAEIIVKSGHKNTWVTSTEYYKSEYNFRKKRNSKWFLKYNPIYFNAESQCVIRSEKTVFLKDYYYVKQGRVYTLKNYWWGGRHIKEVENGKTIFNHFSLL